MASILKYWRESATLILVTSRQGQTGVSFQPVNSGNNTNQNALKGDNFEVLLLKRSNKSKFMPNMYVFPGGVASDADFSDSWNQLFQKANAKLTSNTYDYWKKIPKNRIPMFQRDREQEFNKIPSELAFRICAIRETFEESGVLLARYIKDLKSVGPDFMKNPVHASCYTKCDVLETWRKQVYADASKFHEMCEKLKIVPDVWSLYEWSNWLTPTGLGINKSIKKSGRRYDTAFFVACIDNKPDVMHDEGETVHSQWGTPADVLREHDSKNAQVAPPQLYEISRLLNFENLEELHRFVWQRESKGVQRYFPVTLRCEDAYLALLPGDDLYPQKPDIEVPTPINEKTETLEELNCKYPNHHRTYITQSGLLKVDCNIKLYGDHVGPLAERQLPNDTIFPNAKL